MAEHPSDPGLMNTAAMLEDLGHAVEQAASGEQALALLRQASSRIDLVVTDQMMPGMTGTQLVAAMRAEIGQRPAILASGYAEWPEGGLAGLVRLGKPFSQAGLAEAIAASLPRRSGQRTEEGSGQEGEALPHARHG